MRHCGVGRRPFGRSPASVVQRRDPRTVDPPVPGPIRRLRRGHRPPRGAVGAAEAHRRDLLVNSVRTDLAQRPLHQLLDLRQEPVDQLGAGRRLGRIDPVPAQLHVPAHRVVVAARQLRGPAVAAGEVIRLENLHDLLIALHRTTVSHQVQNIRGEIHWPSVGSFHVRQRGGHLAVNGESAVSADTPRR
jgi:hypothetical protein